MNLCKFASIFGSPGEGVHRYRIFNLAIIDVLFTCIGAYILKYIYFKQYNYFVILGVLFMIGIFCHRIFCVHTTIDKLLFF